MGFFLKRYTNHALFKVPSFDEESAEFFIEKCRVILFNIWDGMKKGVLYKNGKHPIKYRY